jgi:hypothetical protein
MNIKLPLTLTRIIGVGKDGTIGPRAAGKPLSERYEQLRVAHCFDVAAAQRQHAIVDRIPQRAVP